MKERSSSGLTGGSAHRGKRYDSEDDGNAEEARSEDEARDGFKFRRPVAVWRTVFVHVGGIVTCFGWGCGHECSFSQ